MDISCDYSTIYLRHYGLDEGCSAVKLLSCSIPLSSLLFDKADPGVSLDLSRTVRQGSIGRRNGVFGYVLIVSPLDMVFA